MCTRRSRRNSRAPVKRSRRPIRARTSGASWPATACKSSPSRVGAFLADYASSSRGLHYPRAIFSTINLYQALGGTLGALFLGWLVDRIGPRWPWVGLTCIVPLLALLMPLGGHYPVLLFCSLLSGLLITHWSVGAPALLKLSPAGDKSGYIALANMLALPSSVFGPLLIAHLIDGSGYQAGFLFAAIAGLIALLIALTLRPRTPGASADSLPADRADSLDGYLDASSIN